MYVVAIAWLYVLLLVSIMQPTVFRGIVTFVGAGLLPLALLLYLTGTPHRRRSRLRAEQGSVPATEPCEATIEHPDELVRAPCAQDAIPQSGESPSPASAPITPVAPTR